LIATKRGSIESLAFDPKGDFLYAADGKLLKWRWDNDLLKIQREDVADSKGLTFFVAYPTNGQTLYSAGPNEITARQPTGKTVARVERPHEDGIRQVDCSPDGAWVATRSPHKLMIWRNSLIEHSSFQVGAKQRICFHPRLPILVVSGASTKFYSLPDSMLIGEHAGQEARCEAVSPSGELLATSTERMHVVVWRLDINDTGL
jgi:WD40 repeat protein